MRTKFLTAAAAAAVAMVSTNAYAAANLTSVAIQGVGTSTIWNTANDGNYTVFLQQPIGILLNANSEAVSDPTSAGLNSFLIAGEGAPPGTTTDIAAFILVTLNFADGAQISGLYNKAFDDVISPISDTVGNTTYTLTGFSWDRTRADNVSATQAVSGGDRRDYAGQLSFTAVDSAVPEPATWAMMLAGFGMVGMGLRSRGKVRTAVTYA